MSEGISDVSISYKELYFLSILIPSDLSESNKIISFFERVYFLFLVIFFKKLFISLSILDFE